MTQAVIRFLIMSMLHFRTQHTWEQAKNLKRHAEPFNSAYWGFLCQSRCPPSTSVAASSLDPVVVSGEGRSTNSPSVAGEEAVLPMDREEVVLPTDPPAE